jgi:ABC-type polysaccharide/polyol phosphate transport system ATPase subunit
MRRLRLHEENLDLAPGVLISVQDISRSVIPQVPHIPGWLARVLPKSGLAGQAMLEPDVAGDDEDDDDDDEVEFLGGQRTLDAISFEVRAGEGIGLLGPNQDAWQVLLQVLMGSVPPTTGRVVVRGRVAPLLVNDLMRYTAKEWGKNAVFLAARFLNWPRPLLRERWDEIVEFARLDELDGKTVAQYRKRTTSRLLLSSALHMDANVYLIDHTLGAFPAFAMHCLELVEQRQREGAAVVHGSKRMFDEVSRLCREVVWFDEDGTVLRGRPVDVALAVEKRAPKEVHPMSTPILATLAEPNRPVEAPGTVEIELHVLRGDIEFSFVLDLTDPDGRSIAIEQEGRLTAGGVGLYHLRVDIPHGLLPAATYTAKLSVEFAMTGSELGRNIELLSFELAAGTSEVDATGEAAAKFELVEKDSPTQVASTEVETSVGSPLA